MGLTAAIKSDITFNQGQCDQSNYHNYQIMRYPESPEIKVYIMENDENPVVSVNWLTSGGTCFSKCHP